MGGTGKDSRQGGSSVCSVPAFSDLWATCESVCGVSVCASVGSQIPFMLDPAADVTCLPSKATRSGPSNYDVRQSPALQEMYVSFYNSPPVSH